AIDGQPCDPFEPVRRSFPIGPGARFDVIVDLPREEGAEARLILRGNKDEAAGDRDILLLHSVGVARPPLPPVTSLRLNAELPAEINLQSARRVEVALDGLAAGTTASTPEAAWTSDAAAAGLGTKPLFTVKRKAPVVLGLSNKSTNAHAVYLHGHVMRLLHDLDDGWEPYWRDTAIVEPGRTHHIAFVADNPGKWLLECSVMRNPAAGISAWFAVT
ncbi:MAG: multicopper oxidase domain-containing protein, partial [Methylobacteriaceae bacterium]|nr:multicopper oxidase domain-containing protein [Methylobacteriaceae bacterium]